MLWAKPMFFTFHNSLFLSGNNLNHRFASALAHGQTEKTVAASQFYFQLLDSCIRLRSSTEAKKAHQILVKNNAEIEKLVHVYIACGEVELGRRVFDRIPQPNVVSCDLMIRAYSRNGHFEQAIRIYRKMMDCNVVPSKFTFPFALKACSALQAIDEGGKIHNRVIKFGLHSDLHVCTALVDLYAKCGDLGKAWWVFNSIPEKDVVAWNAMVGGLSLHGVYHEAVELLFEMQRAGGLPNSSTIVALLPTIGRANALSQGKAVHGFCVRCCFHMDVVVGTALLDMYAKCQCISYARRIFDTLGIKNEVTWSAMIGACVACDLMREAAELFKQMVTKDSIIMTPVPLASALQACARLGDLNRGKSLHGYAVKSGFILDILVGNTLVSMYAKCSIIDDAVQFLDEMCLKETVAYNAIITGWVQNGKNQEALVIFHEMQLSGVLPDSTTLSSVLAACSHLAALQQGMSGHSYSIVCGFVSNTSICNAVVDMYSKCGKIDIARKVFDRMETLNVVSWNTIIAGYGLHGFGVEALSLFHNMQAMGIKPDEATFISLLSACSHSGLVVEGKKCFNDMDQLFNIVPRMDHYMCMVDLMARAGLLEEACCFIEKMPFEPDFCVWGALLDGCKVHRNVELGEEVSKKIHRLAHEGSGSLVLLSNMYSAVGRWDDAAKVRTKQRAQGLKKSPGCSWVDT